MRFPKNVIEIPVDIYHTTVYVANNRKDFDDLDRYILREKYEQENLVCDGISKTYFNDGGNQISVVGIFGKRKSVIAHEFSHAAFHILGRVGIVIEQDSANEAFTYLLSYLMDRYDEEMTKKRKRAAKKRLTQNAE